MHAMSTVLQVSSSRRAVSVTQIQAVVHRYAYLARNNLKWEQLSKTFRSDTQFHLANGKTLSTSEWKRILEGDQAEYIRHHITTFDLNFDSDSKAVAMVQFFALTNWSSCDHWGEWQMVVSQGSDETWLISEMKIVLDGVDPKGWAAANYQHS